MTDEIVLLQGIFDYLQNINGLVYIAILGTIIYLFYKGAYKLLMRFA